MPAPQPKSKASELEDRVQAFVRSVTHTGVPKTMEYGRLIRDIQAHAKDNVIESNCLEAIVVGIVGQDAEAERLFANAVANNGGGFVDSLRLAYLSNRMQARQACDLGRSILENRSGRSFHVIAEAMMVCGAFHSVSKAIENSAKTGEVLRLTDRVNMVRAATTVLESLKIDEDHCVGVIDTLGEVIRAHGLVWLDDHPGLSVLDDVEGESAVMVRYDFEVSPHLASELTWEFVDRIVQRGLDKPGFYVQLVSA
jgi:hypothetical protein